MAFQTNSPRDHRRAFHKNPAAVDRVDHIQAVLLADFEIFLAVAGRGVNRTRTRFGGDMFAEDDRNGLAVVGMMKRQMFQRLPLDRPQHLDCFQTGAFGDHIAQLAGNDDLERLSIALTPDQVVIQFPHADTLPGWPESSRAWSSR